PYGMQEGFSCVKCKLFRCLLDGVHTKVSRSWLVAVLPLPGYSFSDGHSFFKVQLIDELP
ncbi:hypothetical protein ABHB47_24485, partial [Flavonifractor plautii]|uniref:hypothetical protein n=1 Tax=Flavonifractor plautii TaxID=292800 RepID=UPI00325DE170|nr:hypothetical protein [Flavonifractor plautii]